MTTPPSPPPSTNPLFNAHLRIARPTPSIRTLLPFYTDGLGFTPVGSFTQHNGFDGIMLGHPNLSYHLEFTTEEGHDIGRAPTQENCLVFYVPETKDWETAVARMEKAGYQALKSANPYWDADGKGKTYEDADGWRVVLWNGAWKAF